MVCNPISVGRRAHLPQIAGIFFEFLDLAVTIGAEVVHILRYKQLLPAGNHVKGRARLKKAKESSIMVVAGNASIVDF